MITAMLGGAVGSVPRPGMEGRRRLATWEVAESAVGRQCYACNAPPRSPVRTFVYVYARLCTATACEKADYRK